MDEHIHKYFLAKFTDNSDDAPGTLYAQATDEYEWQGTGLFVCDCGKAKVVKYSPDYMVYNVREANNYDA